MDRGEPTLAPQWLKAAGSSSHSDEHNTGSLSRNRLSVSVCDYDAPRASSSSSFRRSVSNNGSVSHDKDSSTLTRGYSSFGRSHHERDRYRDRQRNRDRDSLLDNGYYDYTDSLMLRRAEDTLRRSQSMVSGRRVESLPKSPGFGSGNGILSTGSLSGGFSKVSFERDFPSLGAEEKQGVFDVGRVSSPTISTAINNLPIGISAVMGVDGWTSALVEAPAAGVGNGDTNSSSLQTTAGMAFTGSGTATGLSMAETLAQAPARARTAPQLSNEDEKLKELALMQYNKLIPVVNASEKSKAKGARNGELVALKAGNFQVLNREKNGTSTTLKDGPPVTMTSKLATSVGGLSSVSLPQLKSMPVSAKIKANGLGGEKKPLLSQDRNNFFNSLRKQAEKKNCILHHHSDSEVSSAMSSSSSESTMSSSVMKSNEQIFGVCAASACEEKNLLATSDSGLEPSVAENGNENVCNEEPEALVAPDEEEKAFLESLGWSENAGEDALTAEEIESFVKKHEEKLGPVFKYRGGLPGLALTRWQRVSARWQ
ncbi:uncharacterized protein A4U43_C03F14540 [Asparagus officinalis]|uniref:Uncharacterized protein n=1 Tax=Asparagus officinalis TaxID=4686 RepID=A0A5P1FAY3_ASPOF|nr:uncharacterized protein LOC109834922 [Asparagus officinalis]ONK75214.1 uncharacterized protein A4U43_C03F14540 [Asparagus officinalis]